MLEEELATYSSADQGFAQIKSSLDACHNFNLQSTSGQSVPANMGAMSYPITGDESVAYTVTATVSGIGLVEDIVIAKKGDVIVAIDLGDVGSVDTSQLQQFVSSAMNKVT